MPRYRYEPGSTEYYDSSKRRVMLRPTPGYRVIDGVLGQIAQCKRDDDAQRIVEALNKLAESKK